MPKTVKESRLKVSIGVAIATLIICLIPIIIIAFVSINHPDVWSAPYPKFAVYFLIISMYFALIIGFIAPLHKIAWLVLHVIAGLATFGFLIAAYIVQDALLIHLASSMLFMFMIYFVSRDSSDNIYLRYSCPLFCLLAALISVLLFMGINLTMVAQNIISAVFNGVYLIILISSFCKFLRSNELRSVTEKQLSYSQETDEERAAAKAKKLAVKREKQALKENNPKTESKKKKSSAAGRVAKSFLRSLIPGSAPFSSEYWDATDWAKHIVYKVDGAPVRNKGSFDVYYSYADDSGIEIRARFEPDYDTTQEEYNSCIRNIKSRFRSACKHCPYSVKLVWD